MKSVYSHIELNMTQDSSEDARIIGSPDLIIIFIPQSCMRTLIIKVQDRLAFPFLISTVKHSINARFENYSGDNRSLTPVEVREEKKLSLKCQGTLWSKKLKLNCLQYESKGGGISQLP